MLLFKNWPDSEIRMFSQSTTLKGAWTRRRPANFFRKQRSLLRCRTCSTCASEVESVHFSDKSFYSLLNLPVSWCKFSRAQQRATDTKKNLKNLRFFVHNININCATEYVRQIERWRMATRSHTAYFLKLPLFHITSFSILVQCVR